MIQLNQSSLTLTLDLFLEHSNGDLGRSPFREEMGTVKGWSIPDETARARSDEESEDPGVSIMSSVTRK